MSSAPQDNSATEVCFLLPQEMAALLSITTKPKVECFTAQSESVMPRAVEREVVALVGQAEVLGALEVVEHAEGVSVELGGRLGHCAAETADREGDVGARVLTEQQRRALLESTATRVGLEKAVDMALYSRRN